MEWLEILWHHVLEWQPLLLVLFNLFLMVSTIIWVLMTKTDSTSAVAWCLLIIFLPYLGSLLFVLFGYQHVHRPLKRKRRHMQRYRRNAPSVRDKLVNEPV